MSNNQYDYFFRGREKEKEELSKLGIRFTDVRVDGDELWPAFILPSGAMILIMQDDEGNGPGSIDVIPSP